MRLIDDDHVPSAFPHCREHFRPLDVVDGADGGGNRQPWVQAGGQRCRAPASVVRVDNCGIDVKSFVQLRCPLFAQAGRRQNEDAVGGPSRFQLREDQAGLNRLSQSHFVGNQHA